tara:strand:+ start:31434 stop:31769 length:336 start_codon:yes stop_codon:yes gene_type:complete
MNKPDHDIKSFFTSMKDADSQTPIPEFTTLYKRKKVFMITHIIPTLVAASFLILFSMYLFNNKKEIDPMNTTFEIVFLEVENNGTQSLIRENPTIYSWTPTSNSLLGNFNE